MKKVNKNSINKIRLISISALLALLTCNFAYATPIKLNTGNFEPLKINTTATINTTTSRKEEATQHVPSAKVPIPEVITDFFAPIEDAPSSLKRTTSADESRKESTEDTKVDDNPFKTINSFAPPSEYIKPEIKTVNSEIQDEKIPSLLPEEDRSYYASAEEELNQAPEINYDGKIIAEVKFKGLKLIGENVPSAVMKTHADTIFHSNVIQQDLQNIYNLGYFTDNMYVDPELTENNTVVLNFILEENITVKKVTLIGNTVFTSAELAKFVEPLEGLPQNLSMINEAIDKINKKYSEDGYILAKVSNVDDNAEGVLTFTISEGIIEKIQLDGNQKTKDYVIQRNILTKTGTIYNENIFKKDIAKIYDTQIFEEVNRKIEPDPEHDGKYIVTVEVKEGSSNNVSIGAGLDSALGVFGSLSYNEKNLFGKGQKLSATGMIGSGLLLSDASIKNRMNFQLELNFFEPHFIDETNSLASKLYYRDLGSYQVPLAIEQRFGWNSKLTHKVRGYDNLSTTLGFGYENINLKEGDYNQIAALYREHNINISRRQEQLADGSFLNIAPGVKYSTLDSEFMPREGLVANANFLEAFGITESKRTNGRLVGGVTRYLPIAKKSTLLVGAKGGIKIHGDEMPEIMAFRLGGPYTIRGFKMNGVGSGESFLMASTELQTPLPFMDKMKFEVLKNLRFAMFMDAGRVFDPTITSTLYDRPLSAITMGVGLRVNIRGMGPISVDYGLPITNVGKYGSKNGYFTFGTGGLYDNY